MSKQENFSKQERIDILKCVFQELHSIRREDEAFENKFTFAICSILLAFSAYTLKGELSFDSYSKLIVILVVVVMTLSSVWFLIRHSKRIRVDCQLIVRIEQCLGLYEDELYISKEQIKALGNQPYASATVYPTILQSWGDGDIFLSLSPHVMAVIFCGVIASCAVHIK